MKTGNTQSPSRQSATTPGGTGRLGKSIVAGLMAALILAVFLAPGFQATPTAEAQVVNNAAMGKPGIVDQANPNDTLTHRAPGHDPHRGHYRHRRRRRHNNGSTGSTSGPIRTAQTSPTFPGQQQLHTLIEEKDIGKALVVKVTFTDDLGNNPEGPLQSTTDPFRRTKEPHRVQQGRGSREHDSP